MGYERLEKSLIDLVKEEQAKLGYRKGPFLLCFIGKSIGICA